MPYESFHARFPEIAQKETRTVTIVDYPAVPKGSYGLIEMYCNESGCDCRRVFLDVYDWERRKSMAIIAYGWENEKFYRKWFGGANDEFVRMGIKDMMGPVLNMTSPQSKYAPAFLSLVTEVLKDQMYVDRLKRHYKIFKDTVNRNAPPDDEDDFDDNDDDGETWPAPLPVQPEKTTKPRKRSRGRRASRSKRTTQTSVP
jgi:hypothetical protein